MTGEMHKSEVTREAFPLHFAIADALKGHVEPFDVYQGPYICVGQDIRAGAAPYAIAPHGLGIVRLWIQSNDGYSATVYNEATKHESNLFIFNGPWAKQEAIEAARSVL